MIEEVKQLLNQGIAPEDLIYYGLEYKFVTEYVVGKLPFEEMFRQLEIAIHQFAKRQNDLVSWYGAPWLHNSLDRCNAPHGRKTIKGLQSVATSIQ